MRVLATVLTLLSLTACGSSVKTNVDAYSALGDEAIGRSVSILPFKPEQASSLQWRTNAGILASELQAKGMQIAPSSDAATYIAYFGFAIDNGETVTEEYTTPVYGTVGYTPSYAYGNTYVPGYAQTGVIGYNQGTSTSTVYTRSMAIDIVERTSNSKVFETRSTSRGSCGSFGGVAREIIHASVKDFPNAARGKVDVPFNGDC
jgi:hypothetical protein